MEVTVIIPVYNSYKFVTQAVLSALQQPETAEVNLIEDGSKDDSLTICQELAEKHHNVTLLRHPDGQNLGASASRNLGIENAQGEYLAFLDADDYYLPNRFTVAREIFDSDPSCDGVYEALGIVFENEAAKHRWLSSPMAEIRMVTMTSRVPPEDLFRRLVEGGAGYFHLNGLIIKKNVINKTGLMDERLKIHQDTDFVIRLAAVAKLLPGRLDEPVAIRRVHENNRISAPRPKQKILEDRMLMRMTTYQWLKKKGFNNKSELLAYQLIREYIWLRPLNLGKFIKLPEPIIKIMKFFLLLFDYPGFTIETAYWKFGFRLLIAKISKKYPKKDL